MKLVIEIPDEVYSHAKDIENRLLTPSEESVIRDSVVNGTPLPERHGRLIDKDKMMGDLLTVDLQYQDLIDWCLQVTEAQPTIIEADGGGEDVD